MSTKRTAKIRTSQSALFLQKIGTVRKLGADLPLDGTLPSKERAHRRDVVRHAPDALVEGIASLASEHDGVLIGVPFDADAAREVIAYGAAARPLVRALRELATRLEDSVLVKRAEIVTQALAAYRAIGAVKGTPQGEPFAKELEDLRAIHRTWRPKSRKAKAAAKAAAQPAVNGAAPAAATDAHAA